jgi:hypothetical protein
MIEVTAEALATHPFLHGMSRDHLAVLAEAATDITFPAGTGSSKTAAAEAGQRAHDGRIPQHAE